MNAHAQSEGVPSTGVDAQNPWPGLAPFTEELKDFFHGRAEEAEELLRRVGRQSLTVLFGQSGLGKSSLLQAGLFPRLRAEGYSPVYLRLDYAADAPPLSEQVKNAVAHVLVSAGGRVENSSAGADDTLWEYFHRRILRLHGTAGEPAQLVLILDQLEELFAVGQASEETRARAAHFLTELADLVENRVPRALEQWLEESPQLARQFDLEDRGHRVLICLREDYLPHLESLRPTMPSIAENRMRLTRMSGLRALEAVLGPGAELIAPDVGRQIVRFVAGSEKRQKPRANDAADTRHENEALAKMEIEPSLLSLVCRELNNRRLALGVSRITTDLLAGSRESILQDYYERCLADQPPTVRLFVEDELVTDSGLRENIALERARKTLAQGGAPVAAIDELVKRRLLHLEKRLDMQRVELTHDVLIGVVKKSREQRQQRAAASQAEKKSREAQRLRRKSRWFAAALIVTVLLAISGDRLKSQLHEGELRTVEASVSQRIDEETANLVQARRELQDRLEAATSQVKELKALAGQVENLQRGLQVKERELLALKETTGQVTTLRRELSVANQEIRSLRVEAERVPDLRDELRKLQRQRDEDEAKAGRMRREAVARLKELDETRERLEKTLRIMQDHESETTRLMKVVTVAQTYRDKAKQLEKEIEDTRRRLTAAERRADELVNEKKTLLAEVMVTKVRDPGASAFTGISLRGRRVVFLVDMSGSMKRVDEKTPAPDKWKEVAGTVSKLMRGLPDLQKYQVILFAEKVSYPLGGATGWLDYDADTTPEKMGKALLRVEPEGGSNLFAALRAAFRLRDDGLETIYLLSDGLPNQGEPLSAEEAATRKESERNEILANHIRKTLKEDWNRPRRRRPRVKINAIGFFYESPEAGSFLWGLARENGGGFVGMANP